ncbi:MAG: TatD family hydrolase, partial [Myxococcota bacterium]|nr:TatD family hydrolase [Myxococcota bacterium]
MSPSYVDIGVNLGHRRFDRDREAVVDRAVAAGVTRMLLTGTDIVESMAMATLASTMPGVLWSTAGVHPHAASSCDEDTLPTLRRLSEAEAVVAIGECGLDFNRDFSPRDVQET